MVLTQLKYKTILQIPALFFVCWNVEDAANAQNSVKYVDLFLSSTWVQVTHIHGIPLTYWRYG